MSSYKNLETARCAIVEFPPPPPYPPPLNPITNINNMPSSNSNKLLQEYSYACCESNCDNNKTTESTGTTALVYPLNNTVVGSPTSNQWIYHLQHNSTPVHRDPSKRHTYVTRYGTEENIYEEISEISRQCRFGLSGSCRSLVAEEVRRVQSRHRRVLGELNLSVEAMLMPSMSEDNEDETSCNLRDQEIQQEQVIIDDNIKKIPSYMYNNKDHSRSSVRGSGSVANIATTTFLGYDLDSGFSGSCSSASYRSGSLRKELGLGKRTSTSCTKLIGSSRKNKASMIWKKGLKKLHSLTLTSKISDEPRVRCQSWDDVGSSNRMETLTKRQLQKKQQLQQNNHPPLEASSSNASAKSEDSWCSASDHDHSSDDESEKSNISVKSNCQLRNTLHKAKTLCDKWRSQNIRFNNSSGNGGVGGSSAGGVGGGGAGGGGEIDSSGQGRLSRWFSIRRGSTHQYDVDSLSSDTSICSPIKQHQSSTPLVQSPASINSPMSRLTEVEEENCTTGGNQMTAAAAAIMQFQFMHQRRQAPPTLPPAPSNLNPQQLKRRHIVAAIVHSENSYVATLQRLVNDYKKPLEESSPPVLSQAKIATLFHRLPEILQCHTLFRIALAECVRSWDRDEKLGDVFVASFSKAVVLDIYSGFINNFSIAMDLAKQESKRKTALADFFKVKQISAHDRLSFFGLMVKPVQRFPQFILFLQDLLKHTPQGHHDRMSLQLALTQLESLAEMLNERKREAEQFQAFKEMLRHVSGKLAHRPLSSSSRYLIREDNVTQLEFNQNGMITKSKRRRLLLLNDLVVCVSVQPRSIDDFSTSERLTLKWTYPVSDIEIQDTSTSPTLSRLLTAGLNKGGSLKSEKSGGMNESSQAGADNLCAEMNDLMHDYEVMSRINDLVTQLKGTYEGMTPASIKQILQSIQSSIQQKDEDMVWADSCCLQLTTKQGQMYTFQTDNPLVKKDWITELRLAQLALDPNNSPSWEIPEQEQRPSTKMPLFVSAQKVYHSKSKSEVRCGCYYYSSFKSTSASSSKRRSSRNPQIYLWICTSDGISSHITVFGQSTLPISSAMSLKKVTTFDLIETRISTIEFIKGYNDIDNNLATDQVWMGTDSRKLIIYSAIEPEKQEEIGNYSVTGPVIQIKYHFDNVFVALGNGSLLIFRRYIDGSWLMSDPMVINLGIDPVACLMPINNTVYAACGKKVWVLKALTGEIIKNFSIQHEHVGNVYLMAHSGVGLWVALKNSSTVCLYHTETFKHLQDINIASNVLRVTKTSILDRLSSPNGHNINNINNSNNNNSQISVTVTALMACKGLLWVGTNVGISLTIPLPRLEGVPIISGRVNISYHAHFGPITFLLAIQNNKPINSSAEEHVQYSTDEQTEIIDGAQLRRTNNYQKNDEDSPKKHIDYHHRASLNEAAMNSSSSSSSPTTASMSTVTMPSIVPSPTSINTANANTTNTSASSSPFAYNVDKLKQQLAASPVALRRKRIKDNDYRTSKTLPRGFGGISSNNPIGSGSLLTSITSSQSSGENCDVYGLYGELMYVKDYENDNNSGIDPMYESLRRSDPELAAIPNKVNTLDRRLKMKITRPRSLDLSNWSVDSHTSSLYTSSGSEENLSKAGKLSRNSSTASRNINLNLSLNINNSTSNAPSFILENFISNNNINNNVTVNSNINNTTTSITSTTTTSTTTNNNKDKSFKVQQTRVNNTQNNNTIKRISKKNNQQIIEQPKRTVLTLMGGCGYINWRQLNNITPTPQPFLGDKNSKINYTFKEPNSNDAHIVLWEMKL